MTLPGTRRWRDRLISLLVWLLCAIPLFQLTVQGFTDGLTANPIEYVLRELGVWGLRFLCITLAISPLAKLPNMSVLMRYRRRVGLWAFAYVCMHLTTYVAIDQQFDWPTIGKDIAKRPYITIGMAAFALLIPLALTSNNWIRKWMGGRKWVRLHRLLYVIAPMGVIHYYLLVKADHRPPLIYGCLVILLLTYRLLRSRWRTKRASSVLGTER